MIAALLLSVLFSTVTLDVIAHRRRPVLEDRSRGTFRPAVTPLQQGSTRPSVRAPRRASADGSNHRK